MRAPYVVIVAAAVALTGPACASQGATGSDGPTGASSPIATNAGFGNPERAGLCEDANVDVAADDPAAPNREAAVDEFRQLYPVLDETTIEGTEIRYGGEVIGQLNISEAPGGGYYVDRAEWCYPE